MKFCSNCGAPLAQGAKFCERCGTPVAQPAATTPEKPQPQPQPQAQAQARPHRPRADAGAAFAPPERPHGHSTWWILPAVIVGTIVIVFVLLIGMPFGRGNAPIERQQAPLDTIGEGTSTAPPTATIVDAQPPLATETSTAPLATQTIPPPTTTQTIPPAQTTTITPGAPPQAVPPAPAAPAPSTTASAPPPAQPRSGELSERESASILRTAAARYYDDVGSECLEIRSHGYVNRGYTMTVWNSCADGGIRLLGRWRVDTENGDVFRQREDGRYLAP